MPVPKQPVPEQPKAEQPEALHTVSETITAERIRRYGELTDDFNPIHTDAAFAAATPMRGLIAHGTLSLNLIWQSLADSLGIAALAGAALDVRFVAPVRIGDIVQAGGQRLADGGYEVWVVNQRGERVIGGVFNKQ